MAKPKRPTLSAALLATGLVAVAGAAPAAPACVDGKGDPFQTRALAPVPHGLAHRHHARSGYERPYRGDLVWPRYAYPHPYRGPAWFPPALGRHGHGAAGSAAPGLELGPSAHGPIPVNAGETGPAQPSSTAQMPADNAAEARVEIGNMRFSPAKVTIEAGATVTWAQQTGMPHTVTAVDASFDSPILNRNGSFSMTFSEPGVYSYYCKLHPSMTGQIEVL